MIVSTQPSNLKVKAKKCFMCQEPTTYKDGFCRNIYGGISCEESFKGREKIE